VALGRQRTLERLDAAIAVLAAGPAADG
jgi:hypothetical protein